MGYITPQKLAHEKTKFVSKVIFFKTIFKFNNAINLCYLQQRSALQNTIPIL